MKVCSLIICLISLFGRSDAEFSWKLCDDDSGGSDLRVYGISITPDPISIDAYAYVDFEAELTRNLTGPVTLSLSIKKIVHIFWLFKKEIAVPCLTWAGDYGIGSCTYDVCEMAEHLERLHGCPTEFTANGIPCTCPIRPGLYGTSVHPQLPIYLDTSSVPFIPGTFLSGDYRTTVRLADGMGNLCCFEYTNSITN